MDADADISKKIYALICEIPQAQLLLDSLAQSNQFGVAIFGGALRDLIAQERSPH